MQEEIEQNNVAEQVVTEAQEESVQQSKQEVTAEETRQDRNWRAARERQKQLEHELKAQREMNEKLLQMQLANQKPFQQEEPEEPDEDFITKGKVKQVAKKYVDPLEKKIADLEAKLEQQNQQNMFQMLRQKHTDFDEVVTQESMQILEEQEPELAATIAASKDPYKVLLASYKYIKALGIAGQPENKRAKEVDKKIAKNASTVQSPQVYDKRPLAQAFNILESPEEQKKLYQEMIGYASKVGFSY